MSEHDFISLGIPVGTSRLTISATSVASLSQFLNEVNEVDETDPEGVSPISNILDHIETINAAVTLKFPNASPQAASSPAVPASSGNAGKTCAHGPMTYREGVSNATGKQYKAYFCPAPRGTNQCKPEFVNNN